MASDTAHIKGMSEVAAKLKNLPYEFKDKVAYGMTLTATETILAAVQTFIPIKSGLLFHNVRIAARKKNIPWNIVQYVIFVRSGTSKKKHGMAGGILYDLPYYWYFVEFGYTTQAGRHIAANPFMAKGFAAGAANGATRARDYAAGKVATELAKK